MTFQTSAADIDQAAPLSDQPLLSVRLTAVTFGAELTNFYEFRSVDGSPLPPFQAGAHVDVHLPNGLVRQYSLSNAPGETHRYVIGVKRDGGGRGGSQWLHDKARVGELFTLGAPRNNFPLAEDASSTILLAGGIGLTPIWCMAQRLEALGLPWTLQYAARTRGEAPLLDALAAYGDRVKLHFDDEQGGILDIAALLADAPADAHIYCCGPGPMLASFEAATAERTASQVHVEYFAPKSAPVIGGGFVVTLARSGRDLTVAPGQTILEALTAAGVAAPSSCQQGVCGICETAVISGEPDHQDSVLTPAERASGKTMMICCSGSKTDRLVLDL